MKKIKVLVTILLFITTYHLTLTPYPLLAQDSNVTNMTKQIMEAPVGQGLIKIFNEASTSYLKENKYNEWVEFLKSLPEKKKALEPFTDYYISQARYQQLKYLEEAQNWDEYFAKGNDYRDEIASATEKAIAATTAKDTVNIYARLILWQFHKDQQDVFHEEALTNLMNAVSTYAKENTDSEPVKIVADKLSAYQEKGKAKELYKIYVEKLITASTKDEELSKNALTFYQEGNLELAESIYDIYIDRITKSSPTKDVIPILIEIAKQFSIQDKPDASKDAFYAQKVFAKIEELGTKEAFNEELLYLCAFNLEKAKEYKRGADFYAELVKRYPESPNLDLINYKLGIIYTYALRDINKGKIYFEKLSQNEPVNSGAISSLYQLGLLTQWEGDSAKAKGYYNNLIDKAKADFPETTELAKERLKEIEEALPIDYNIKMFLDTSLKEENASLDMGKSEVNVSSYKLKKDEELKITSGVQLPQSGCLQIELQYLWSGTLGKTKPSLSESLFNTSYNSLGIKEINLVVISPTGIVDRNFEIVEVKE